MEIVDCAIFSLDIVCNKILGLPAWLRYGLCASTAAAVGREKLRWTAVVVLYLVQETQIECTEPVVTEHSVNISSHLHFYLIITFQFVFPNTESYISQFKIKYKIQTKKYSLIWLLFFHFMISIKLFLSHTHTHTLH